MHFSIGASRDFQLDPDVATILLTVPSSKRTDRTIKSSTSSCSLRTAARMDRARYDDYRSRQDVRRHRDNANTRHRTNSDGLGPQPYSSPLPQTLWSDVPLPYRPHDWVPPHPSTYLPINDPAHDWRLRPSQLATNQPSSSAVPEPLRTRRRPRDLNQPRQRYDVEQPFDVSLLYPEMNPYADELHGRSVSQPSTPNFMQARNTNPADDSDPHPFHMPPRSPTYPPTGRRRMHSATGAGDAAFADEQEFRLFVEATAGLPPETSFRHSISVSSPSSSRRQRSRDWDMSEYQGSSSGDIRSPPNEPLVSPINETPTTMMALTQLAQLPQATTRSTTVELPRRQRMETSPSGLDLWLPSPRMAVTPVSPNFAVTLVEEEEEVVDDDDDLPDYAASQAQAQASQRVEAARRARELQRRWQASSGGGGY